MMPYRFIDTELFEGAPATTFVALFAQVWTAGAHFWIMSKALNLLWMLILFSWEDRKSVV